MILNGGVFLTTAVCGRPQTYKSSVCGGYFGRVMRYYRQSHGLFYETELTMPGISRVTALSGAADDEIADFESRVEFYDKTELSLEDIFEVIKNIAKEKDSRKKELIRETPFIDQDGKHIKSWVPTIVVTDSFSAASSSKEVTLYDENNVGDSKTNMVNMNDGRIKTDFCRQIPQLCAPRGIYIISSAHIGNNNTLDPYSPPAKDLPMMRVKDKLKNVGTQYSFLSTTMVETRKVEPLLDSNKKCAFPSASCSSDMDLQRITAVITRCKNNVSGASFDHISSQFEGLQEFLEYYLLVKETKSALIEGTTNQTLGIYDKSFTRHDIRQKIKEDYQFRRALEILGHFVFVRNRWNLPNVKNMGYVDFCKKLNASKSLKEEILNSTGVWRFIGDETDRPYMSILDIIEKISAK